MYCTNINVNAMKCFGGLMVSQYAADLYVTYALKLCLIHVVTFHLVKSSES